MALVCTIYLNRRVALSSWQTESFTGPRGILQVIFVSLSLCQQSYSPACAEPRLLDHVSESAHFFGVLGAFHFESKTHNDREMAFYLQLVFC